MPFTERRSFLPQTEFPLFGKLYLILFALRCFSKAGVRSSKPYLMHQELFFSEDFTIIIIHAQIAGANIIMFISNILVDKYSAAYSAYVTQELILTFLTFPLCVIGIMGYLSLNVRRILYLTGQGFAFLALIGTGNINAFIAEQFSDANHNKYLLVRDYVSLVFTFLGVLILPHIGEGNKCVGTDNCYIIAWILDWATTLLSAILFLSSMKYFYKSQKIKNGIIVLYKLLRDGRKEKNQSRLGSAIQVRLQSFMPTVLYSKLYDSPTRQDAAKVWATWKYFIPLSCYWALINQYTTTWIFQAQELDGSLGFKVMLEDYHLTILPNQIWGVIPLTGLVFTPIMSLWARDTLFPVRVMIVSQIAISIAFFVATYLEFYVASNDNSWKSLPMYWAIPQHILASFSEICSVVSIRLFNLHTVPRSMQQVSRNMLILSRALGNILVVIVSLFRHFFDYPTRQMQLFSYPILLCTFIVGFTLMNPNFETLLND